MAVLCRRPKMDITLATAIAEILQQIYIGISGKPQLTVYEEGKLR